MRIRIAHIMLLVPIYVHMWNNSSNINRWKLKISKVYVNLKISSEERLNWQARIKFNNKTRWAHYIKAVKCKAIRGMSSICPTSNRHSLLSLQNRIKIYYPLIMHINFWNNASNNYHPKNKINHLLHYSQNNQCP